MMDALRGFIILVLLCLEVLVFLSICLICLLLYHAVDLAYEYKRLGRYDWYKEKLEDISFHTIALSVNVLASLMIPHMVWGLWMMGCLKPL